mmetsp:Transcript_52568/g.97327  ORF Transcript_52568/g.97327 Transcript_52568/m.97327 type:complete len:222 (+) Transcript_52568:71-736(+)
MRLGSCSWTACCLQVVLFTSSADIVFTHRTLANVADMEALRLAAEGIVDRRTGVHQNQSLAESAGSSILPRAHGSRPQALNYSVGQSCFPVAAYSDETVGCNAAPTACMCRWFHSCYPKHVNLDVEGRREALDVGVCQPSMVILFVFSTVIVMMAISCVVGTRLLLEMCGGEDDAQMVQIAIARQEDLGDKCQDDEHDDKDSDDGAASSDDAEQPVPDSSP